MKPFNFKMIPNKVNYIIAVGTYYMINYVKMKLFIMIFQKKNQSKPISRLLK